MLALLHFNLGKRCLPSYKMLALLHFNLGKRCLPSYKMLALVQDARPISEIVSYYNFAIVAASSFLLAGVSYSIL
jgi:hypothetical protein